MNENLKKCPKCGWEIANVATVCPNCNHNFLQPVIREKKQGSKLGKCSMILGIIGLLFFYTELGIFLAIVGIVLSLYVMFSKKEVHYKAAVTGFVTALIAIVMAFGDMSSQDEPTKETSIAGVTEIQQDKSDSNKADMESETLKELDSTDKATSKPKTEKQKKKEYINACKTYNYKTVLRNPKKYIGKKIKVKLKISSVHEEGWLNSTKYYFAWSEGDYGWYENEYVVFDERSKQKPKLLEDDIIEVYGEIVEPEDTVSLIVNSSEVFAIDMKYVKLISE